jgi:hypothetical protein
MNARAMRQPSVENIAALRTAIGAEHQSGTRVSSSLFVSQLAQAELKAGNVMGAEAALREAFALVEIPVHVFGLPTYTAYPVMSC